MTSLVLAWLAPEPLLALLADSLGPDLVAVGAQPLELAPPPTQEQGAAPELVQPQSLAEALLQGLAGTLGWIHRLV